MWRISNPGFIHNIIRWPLLFVQGDLPVMDCLLQVLLRDILLESPEQKGGHFVINKNWGIQASMTVAVVTGIGPFPMS